ncbi:MAG TPA: peptide-methionine (S)-S-oxide reductase MsrA [Chitinispirillaceae bacterium]|nr:peptide-methionine (S)-S-oxide reductase MsrA [Chitinispirillaceae bacterium]
MAEDNYQKATFAGGCFWCMQGPFDFLEGVVSTKVGYTGGKIENPSYEEVSSGATGHTEAIEVLYDPQKVNYMELLDTFWRNIDPTAINQQFADKGSQYRTAIFYHNDEQKQLAEQSKSKLEKSGKFDKPIVTEILPAARFYLAEDYHQDYYKKNPFHYEMYKHGSGRSAFIERVWKSKH